MITQTDHKIPVFALIITMLALMSGCAGPVINERNPDSEAGVPGYGSESLGKKAAAVAFRQVGVPYRYGGSTTSGFDCSGLVQFSYKHAGKNVPRTTGQLWSATTTVPREDLQVGDLLFFNIEGKMSHVGLYIGEQQFVHAPSTGRTVSVANLTSPFYASAFVRAGRPK
jgi:cell wall-associated NlpC family hydrolase